jgi:serine/threonine protein kinase
MTDGVAIKIIGNYQITGELSAGGMGTVYRGHHLSLPREVVIKAISLHEYHPQHHGHLRTRFFREALVQSQLDHPHIVRVYEFFAQQENHYIVMEFIAGLSVAQLLEQRGAMQSEPALSIIKQVLLALDYAHHFNYVDEARQRHTGLVHRDIKPANILLDGQLKAKLTDFGIVKAGSDQQQQLTSTGFQPGTVEYMSPEQICGSEVDARSDIYSLGVTLYQMLSGRVPFSASTSGSDYEVRKGHVELSPPPLRELRPEISAGLAAIVDKALAKKPADRFQSAKECLAAIERYEHPATKDFSTNVMPYDPSFARDTARVSGSVHSSETDNSPTIATLPEPSGTHSLTEPIVPPTIPAPAFVQTHTPPSAAASVSASRNLLLPLFVTGALLLIGAFIAWQLISRMQPATSQQSAVTLPTQSATSVAVASPQTVMRISLTILADGQQTRRSGAEPLTKKDEFRFHFTPSHSGYLYIVSPGDKNVPTTFLTTKPFATSGVTTNYLEANREYAFPGGNDNIIELDRSLQTTPFIIVFARQPLTEPAFLTGKAGRRLTLNEQSELEAFRQKSEIVTATLHSDVQEMLATVPAEKAAASIIIFEIPIRQQ